jgi:RNA polymerase sigma-70 factor (ECF subfamily)
MSNSSSHDLAGSTLMIWHGIDLHWAYSALLPNICRQIVCKQSALDILHDSLVRFALARNPNRHEQPHAYLQIIVRNLMINNHRVSNRFVPLQTEDFDTEDRTDADKHSSYDYAFAPSAEHLLDVQQRIVAMQSLIDRLPPRCREVFWLYRIEGLSQAEIASRLGVSLNMVERHVMRSMQDLLKASALIQ